jgi:hypothetical protein
LRKKGDGSENANGLHGVESAPNQAKKVGLKVGQIIASVNGVAVDGMNHTTVRHLKSRSCNVYMPLTISISCQEYACWVIAAPFLSKLFGILGALFRTLFFFLSATECRMFKSECRMFKYRCNLRIFDAHDCLRGDVGGATHHR